VTSAATRPSLFRREALAHSAGITAGEGEVLQLSPRWSVAAYWVLVGAFIAGALVLVFGTVDEYASGGAVVWVERRVDLTATIAATVSVVYVHGGERVARGAVLARFHSTREEAELARVDHALGVEIARTLRDPADRGARAAVATLAAEKDQAASRLDELTIRAPQDGLVGDVRIREGQRLAPGDIVVTLLDDAAERTLIAILPGHAQPRLRPGMPIRFEVTGYKYAYQELTIASVGSQVVGPAVVKRYLGQELADTVPLDGSFVLVEAKIPGGRFSVDGTSYDLRHGMSGTAEARVRSQRLLFALVPGIRALTEAGR
jgi:multidrug resistance efflux pump